ncbi:MAG: extracellular solute-binding protein [Thermohalobaculum sp.]|nr:extracellular solute-binding protein [Thermohalobaculum sp.]
MQQGFAAFPYTNPAAPAGGRATFGELGGFDSLNPFILKGRAPWAVSALSVESLMARSYDEPFTLYGLLAETVETPLDRSWVAFTLREGARFSDGSPVTVEDVIWSFETLGREGHPRYRNAWDAVAAIRKTGERGLRVEFSAPNRELALLLGLRPVLKRAQWEGRELTASGLEPVIGSGPYVVAEYEPGRVVTFRRDPDWWGADLAVNRGLNNFDEVRFEFFRNADALWQAVQTGAVDFFADADPVRWVEGYDFPAAAEGRIRRTEIAHGRPTGMEGFVFNTRRAPLDDRRVREALALAFDWEWMNQRLYRGQLRRIRSYFDNSALGFGGPAEGREREILAPFADRLPPGTLEAGWRPPVSDGTGRDRRNLRAAAGLLEAAGWEVRDGQRVNAAGQPLALEVLVMSTEDETLASLWSQALARLGVKLVVRRVDAAQYQMRRQDYDYDIVTNRWSMSLSPGTEQRLYFGAGGREMPGTRNYMGVADPAVEAAIDAMLAAVGEDEFRAAVRALDRVLSAGIYVVPFGVLPTDRIAHSAGVRGPARAPVYGWWGWSAGPALWWRE